MESYNRSFNDLFPCPNPGLYEFCDVLEGEISRGLTRYTAAKDGALTSGVERRDVQWPVVPEDFAAWVEKFNSKKRKR